MLILIIILVTSVFLGTELFAIPTPGFQLSIYRITLFTTWIFTMFQFYKRNPQLKLRPNTTSFAFILAFLFWWLWGLMSVFWSFSFGNWLRAMFLLSLGVSAILLLYFWIKDLKEWHQIIKAVWLGMCLLLFWGYYELITNHYIFANLSKLDKHGTFASHPFSRIPVTVFENQNDFATMLLAFLVVSMILYHLSSSIVKKLCLIFMMGLASYLVFRSESRMILLSYFLIFVVRFILNFRIDFKEKHWYRIGLFSLIVFLLVLALYPPALKKIDTLFYFGYGESLDGDTVRVNLWRNGMGYLGQTFGLGVGAGNIEFWMTHFKDLPTKIITNMHNWWLEILVGYGLPVFLVYTVMYGTMIYQLWLGSRRMKGPWLQVSNDLVAFLIVYIFASITSANNMLIEWHWVFFGIIVSYFKLMEARDDLATKEYGYEFINNI